MNWREDVHLHPAGMEEEASELEKICFAARAEVEEATEQLEGLQSEAAGAREVAHWTAAELQVRLCR